MRLNRLARVTLMQIGRFFRLAALCTSAAVAASLSAFAQTLPAQTADDQMGIQPFQSYHGGAIDHIGLANGTLSLDYPFLSYPQRGKLHLDFHLYYNNQPQHLGLGCFPGHSCVYIWGYTPAPNFLPLEKGDVLVGWAQQTFVVGTGSNVKKGTGNGTTTWYYDRWSVQTADGATHPLGNLGTQTYVSGGAQDFYAQGSGPWESLDATGWRVNGSIEASNANSSAASGVSVVDPEGIINGTVDPNGNTITVTTNGSRPTAFTDSLGRQIPAPPSSASTSNANTSACPSGPLPVESAVSWVVPAPNGGNATYIFCYVTVTINDGPGLANTLIAQPTTVTKLQSIVLPDGHSWGFQCQPAHA